MDEKKTDQFTVVETTEWDKGNPVFVKKTVLATKSIKEMPLDILSEIYEGPELKYQGKTKAHVLWSILINKALDGDGVSIENVFNRILGRPVQQNLNLNTELNYEDFLNKLNGTTED
jgi:hypothetical protein